MPAEKVQPHLFEKGDRIYLVAPVSPFEPGEADIEEFAFSDEVKKGAPNPSFLWLKGNYVESEKANANGHTWTAKELSIKSLTPMYCPVTVMHDPRTAVGLIADTRLLTPEKDNVPRSRIETALALWAHRFPEVAEEVKVNYEQGMLMQSMECHAPYYSCAECGQTFHKLPDGAEQGQWCEHLAENRNAGRILGGVTFTGTGLIFGSRGARGAYSEAHLETALQEEIASAHQEVHQQSSSGPKRKSKRSVIPMEKMEIARSEYDELHKRPTPEELASEKTRADQAEEAKQEAERKLEAEETEKKKVEKERDDFKAKVEEAEEKERKSTLKGERFEKLGGGFLAALGENTKKRLETDAQEMKDEDFEARLVELEELTETERDTKGENETASGENGGGSGDLSREETASASLGGGGGGGDTAPSEAARGSIVGGLVRRSGRPGKGDDK